MGANMYSFFKTGELKSEGSSITEGIGQGRITENLRGYVSWMNPFRVDDSEALTIFSTI